ncbi:peptidase [Lentinula boryana]|uniref:Peptide hydrolase n=1 Tax=Lentinula boryana TaxID=40481 RepID=A0ABQ8QGS4_9AGAR|nr:peptidase [Lentinula boryana]
MKRTALFAALHVLVPLVLAISESQVSLSSLSSNSSNQPLLSSTFDNGFDDVDFDEPRLVRFIVEDPHGDAVMLEEPVWLTERVKLDSKRTGDGYIDITEHPNYNSSRYSAAPSPTHVYHPPNSTIVPQILPLLSTQEQRSNLEIFTSFHTRYYKSKTGHASSRWLYQRVLNYTDEYATDALREAVGIELVLYEHKGFKQESVIIRLIPRRSLNSSESVEGLHEITIIGAHCDSINGENPFYRSPGADDDGSGTITILEAYRAILQSGYVPLSPLEFHLYAAEEGGLLGSLDISDAYAKAGKDVRGMIEFDMTVRFVAPFDLVLAWVAAGRPEEIGVVMNHADLALSKYTKLLIEKYLDIPWIETRYPGRATSDYMAWTMAGYQSSHVLEGAWEGVNKGNPHQVTDSIDVSPEFSFEHIMRFTQLAVAFAVELSSY